MVIINELYEVYKTTWEWMKGPNFLGAGYYDQLIWGFHVTKEKCGGACHVSKLGPRIQQISKAFNKAGLVRKAISLNKNDVI